MPLAVQLREFQRRERAAQKEANDYFMRLVDAKKVKRRVPLATYSADGNSMMVSATVAAIVNTVGLLGFSAELTFENGRLHLTAVLLEPA